jgi:Na+-translocating ferredoxin:NAD+ oxidoreductase subunit B
MSRTNSVPRLATSRLDKPIMPDIQRSRRKRIPEELAVIDADRCTGCEACIEVCPVDCIAKIEQYPETPGLQGFCEIDWDRCIGCRLCVQIPSKGPGPYSLLVCPWEAITMLPPSGLAAAADDLGGPPWYAEANRHRLRTAAARQANQGQTLNIQFCANSDPAGSSRTASPRALGRPRRDPPK